MPNYNGVWSLSTQYQYVGDWPSAPTFSLFGTGQDAGTYSTVIQKVDIVSAGNAVDFGDLSQGRWGGGALASATRAVFGGGVADLSAGDGNNESDVMDYVTIASAGNATDFGNLSQKRRGLAGLSNSTRGVFCGGYSGSKYNVMDYITIGSTGNATDFGDLIAARLGVGAFASTTRGLIGGGDASSTTNEIDYITIGSAGNGTDFGNLSGARKALAGLSSSVRGIFGGGNGVSNVMDYFTIASTGNATDFGNLTGSLSNIIDSVIIATTGNASDFGDLLAAHQYLAGCSGSHGGIA